MTVSARKNGALILRDADTEEHLDKMGAVASCVDNILMFRRNGCISDVLEETYHYEQHLLKLNGNEPEELRNILNEIDAKEYLINNSKKYQIPRNETDETKNNLNNINRD